MHVFGLLVLDTQAVRRSKQHFTTWLQARSDIGRADVEVVAVDGFKTATTEQFPAAGRGVDPFRVVRLPGDAMDACRRRAQRDLHDHRGRTGDPLCRGRRTLHTKEELLTDR